MPITEHQREQRAKHLGSSDMAAILGVDPYRTAYDVWLDKTGQLEDAEPNAAMDAGTRFEDSVLEWAGDQLGPLRRNQYRSNPDLHLGANIDAILLDASEPVEAKTAGLFGPLSDDWGDDGTDQVPDRVIVQCHVHMLCLNGSHPKRAHVPAFLGGRGFARFHVDRNDTLCDIIAEHAVEFWTKHVVPVIPPANTAPSMDSLKRVRREPNKVAVIDPSLVEQWQEADADAKAMQKRADELKAKVIAAGGDAEAFDFGDGDKWLTYYEQTRESIDSKLLKADLPEVARQYQKATTYRVLRLSKQPKARR